MKEEPVSDGVTVIKDFRGYTQMEEVIWLGKGIEQGERGSWKAGKKMNIPDLGTINDL